MNETVENANSFNERIYEIVNQIPPGRVLTYGSLALLAGRPDNARAAGKLMSQAPEGVRAHRVVNHAGRTAPGWPGQRELLEGEGVAFKPNGCVDLRKHLWRSE